MSERPSWWDQVKEVDREEAEVLFLLGLPVWCEWPLNHPGRTQWECIHYMPVKRRYLTRDWCESRRVIYYVDKGGTRMSTASKPPWAHLVKEIDKEEAIVLISLGVDVWADYYDSTEGWYTKPFAIFKQTTVRKLQAFCYFPYRKMTFFYTRLGDNNDATA